jgi:hypothetical protein
MTKFVTRAAFEPAPPANAEAFVPPRLAVVEASDPGECARRLIREARAISLEHLAAVAEAMATARSLLQSVVDSGDLYTPALVDFAAKLGEDLFQKGKSLEAFTARQRELSGL